MSDKIKLSDGVNEALEAFRGDTRNDKEERYIVLSYQGKTTIVVKAQGAGGLDDAKASLSDDDAHYILLRKIHQVDTVLTVKFAYIDWTPETIRPMRKALLSTHKGQIEDVCKPYHVSLQAGQASELDENEILDRIGFSSGTKSNILSRQEAEAKRKTAPKAQRKFNTSVPKSVTASRSLDIEGEDELKAAIAEVRSDDSDIDWVAISYANVKTLTFIGKGSGGITEMTSHFNADNVFYGLFRVTEQFDKSTTVKFGFVKLLSDKMSPVTKAKYSTHLGFVKTVFEPFHHLFMIDEVSQLTPESVHEQFQLTMGTKTRVISDEEAERKMAHTNRAAKKRTNLVPTVGQSSRSEKELGIGFEDEDAFKAAVAAVRSDADDTTWLVTSYVSKDTLGVIGTGTGDVDEALGTIENDKVNFALIRVHDQIDKSDTVKFVYIKCQPSGVSPMTKAQVGVKKGAIDKLFSPYHVDFFIESASEISKQAILDKVQAASGSKSNVTDRKASGRIK